MKQIIQKVILIVLLSMFSVLSAQTTETLPSFKFNLGNGVNKDGYIKINTDNLYSEAIGYGFDLNSEVKVNSSAGKMPITDGFITSNYPFFFSVKLPEGNYHVKVTLGDDNGTSDTSIRVENRRMMVNRLETKKGTHEVVEFTVNVRDSLIKGSTKKVNLKDREYAYLHWDNKLTLEFNSTMPKVNAIEVYPEDDSVISIFLAGDSTMVDGASEPYSAWGQMFPWFFEPSKIAVINLAESGETLKGFIYRRRFDKLLSMMKPGDYAFVQFGHNDQKQKGEGVGAFTSFTKDLEFFINKVKKKGGIPVLVTSVQRRRFDKQGKIRETLGDYPEAMRVLAKNNNIALIDLNAKSKVMFEAMGEEGSILAFAHFPLGAFPNTDKEIKDNTHFRPFGAYEVAKLVLQGVRESKLEIAKFIKKDIPRYSADRPDSYDNFYWPESPSKNASKPDGN